MLLAAQGFGESFSSPINASDIEACIKRMGVLQIDTIHVVARSPYLVLWSRLGPYEPSLLDECAAAGRLFEYWSHEACFIPIEDFPFYRRLILEERKKPRVFQWLKANAESASAMLDHVRANGPTRSSDFERSDGKKGTWWDWKAEKVALDFLHTSGDLMILRRDKFQRIYDVLERVLPQWDDALAPTYEEVLGFLVAKTVGCLGVAANSWCSDYFRLPKKDVSRKLEELAAEGYLLPASIEGISGPAFISPENSTLAKKVLDGFEPSVTALLSPFDPVVWDRKRALELFDFDYRIECYVPEPKRTYGYFVLPILVGNAIMGRLDAKAHRKEKVFEVKNLYLEPKVAIDEALIQNVATAIKRCATWHKTPTVTITQGPTVKLSRRIQSAAKRVKL